MEYPIRIPHLGDDTTPQQAVSCDRKEEYHDTFSIALVLHIVGALGMFAAFAIEWTSLAFVRRAATAEQAREWLGGEGWVRRLGPASLTLIVLTGLYMMAPAWRWVAWILVTLAAIVLIAILGTTFTGLRMPAIGQAAAVESGPLSTALRQRLSDPLVWASLTTRTAIALGIVFLMVIRPDLGGSLITIGLAIALGLAFALPIMRRGRARGGQALPQS